MRIYSLALITTYVVLACGSSVSSSPSSESQSQAKVNIEDTVVVVAQLEITFPIDSVFKAIDSSYTHKTLLLPKGFTATVLFAEKDLVTKSDGSKHPAKGNHDMLEFMPNPNNPNKGWLYVSHETKYKDSNLGDGGGATMFEISKNEKGIWSVIGDYHHVDFSTVRDTDRNCGGKIGPNGMIYTCEENSFKNNKAVYAEGKGHTDTSNVGSLKMHENFGWVVEVDPNTKKATQKIIAMGRYFHEDLEFMDDNKTVYLSDDYEPGVFFKFVADKPLEYSQGQLYAYKQSADGQSGEWLALPRDTATMIRARDAAIELGATMFVRHEWFVRIGTKIYIAETGHDRSDWSYRIKQGGVPAKHLYPNNVDKLNIMTDVFGRILVFDTETNKMEVVLEGGISKDGKTVFSNPDCITTIRMGGHDYLVIHEDINWYDKKRVPTHIEKRKQLVNELFFLDLSIENPTVEDLKRFAIAPIGAEFTGGIFSPDGSTLFLNVMHPNSNNSAPYNKSVTIAITGFKTK